MSESEQLAHSWDANAGAWTRVVRGRGIESRRVATDAAIIDAIVARAPRRVLDVGCGEGWLSRELTARGVTIVGIDGSAQLIAAARASGGEFQQVAYHEICAQPERLGLASYDVVVCNFALFDEHLHALLRSLWALLTPDGALLIQTVHPWSARGDGAYSDGWRRESFAAFDEEFAEAMPWYFRTLGSWVRELSAAGFSIERIMEPVHPETGDSLSLIIVANGLGRTLASAAP